VTPPAALDDKPAAKAVTRKSEAPRHPREEDATEQAAEAQAQTCERLARTLRDLDARMRAGYSAREAGRLWDRWRETRERLREAGC
jgi:hypothetical protein